EGTKYECEWRNDERHGKGKEIWADGTSFNGSYAKGMRSGEGVMTWPEGSRYSGQFESGRANGKGELIRWRTACVVREPCGGRMGCSTQGSSSPTSAMALARWSGLRAGGRPTKAIGRMVFSMAMERWWIRAT
ncbi:unnamed protein product, partial [Polarella glacialis]